MSLAKHILLALSVGVAFLLWLRGTIALVQLGIDREQWWLVALGVSPLLVLFMVTIWSGLAGSIRNWRRSTDNRP
jgi:hypothetical protein